MLKSPAFSTSFLESRMIQKLKSRKSRIKPGLFAFLLAERIIFGKKTQRQAAAPKSRISPQGGSRFLFPAFPARFRFFQSPRQRDAGPKKRTSLCEVRFFVARIYGFVPIDTTAGVVPVPQSIAPCGRWFPRSFLRRGKCWLPKEKSSRAFLQAGLLFG